MTEDILIRDALMQCSRQLQDKAEELRYYAHILKEIMQYAEVGAETRNELMADNPVFLQAKQIISLYA